MATTVCFLCILFVPFSSYSFPNKTSKEFKNLLNEVHRLYIKPKGWNLSEMERKAPGVLASVIGHALRQQLNYVKKKPSLKRKFKQLQIETQGYFVYVARVAGYRDSLGNKISPQDLWQVALDYIRGDMDKDVWQNFGVKVGSMASVLDSRQASSSGDSRTPSGRIYFDDDEDSLNLLGQKLNKPTTVPSEQDVKPSGRKFNPKVIVGTWEFENKHSPGRVKDRFRMRINQVGPNLYHGKFIWTNNVRKMEYLYGVSLNQVWLKIKYSGHNDSLSKVPLFVGQRQRCDDFRDKGRGCIRTSWENLNCLYYPRSDTFAVYGVGGNYYKRR